MTSEVGAQSTIVPRKIEKKKQKTKKPKKQNFGFYWMGRVAARAKICVLVFSFSVF